MASAEPAEPISVPNTLRLPQTMDQTPAESTPVEMSTLSRQMDGAVESTEPSTTAQDSLPEPEASTSDHAKPSIPSHTSHQTDGPPSQSIATASHQPQPQAIDTTPQNPTSATSDRPEPLIRTPTTPAIGPSSDKPTPLLPESPAQTLFITLLLTNGARHPYKIDEKYLQKRRVTVEGNNPVLMSIYTLKELIWREWREGRFWFSLWAWPNEQRWSEKHNTPS